jgi:hypothetical protein
LLELVLLGLERQEEVYPFHEKETKDCGEMHERGPKEVPMDCVEDTESPVVVLLEIRTLCDCCVEVPHLRGDVVGQGDALDSEGYQTGGEKWDLRSRMLEAREFRGG